MTILFFTVYLLCSLSGVVLFKANSADFDLGLRQGLLQFSISPLALLGVAFYITSFIMGLFILKNSDISSVQPVLVGISTILIFSAGIIRFNEAFTLQKLAGLLLIVGGVFLMTFARK